MNGSQDTLARLIWGEARGVGPEGMTGVACVVLNRVKQPRWWGTDIVTVCLKPWQFSCFNTSDPNRAKLLAVTVDDPQFAEAMQISAQACSDKLQDVTSGSDSYFDDSLLANPPKWSIGLTQQAKIGRLNFFRTI